MTKRASSLGCSPFCRQNPAPSRNSSLINDNYYPRCGPLFELFDGQFDDFGCFVLFFHDALHSSFSLKPCFSIYQRENSTEKGSPPGNCSSAVKSCCLDLRLSLHWLAPFEAQHESRRFRGKGHKNLMDSNVFFSSLIGRGAGASRAIIQKCLERSLKPLTRQSRNQKGYRGLPRAISCQPSAVSSRKIVYFLHSISLIRD